MAIGDSVPTPDTTLPVTNPAALSEPRASSDWVLGLTSDPLDPAVTDVTWLRKTSRPAGLLPIARAHAVPVAQLPPACQALRARGVVFCPQPKSTALAPIQGEALAGALAVAWETVASLGG